MREDTKEKRKILFFSFVGAHYSRSSTILNFDSERYSKEFISLPKGAFANFVAIILMHHKIKLVDFYVVMSPCHMVAPILKLLSSKKVILDAGWSLTDGQLSRSNKIKDWPKLVRTYAIDLVAFHTADKVVVESNNQAARIVKLFGIPKKKIEVNFTGLDETAFPLCERASRKMAGLDLKLKSVDRGLTVVFRGKINNESGFENILEAARILENKVWFILVSGNLDTSLSLPSNTIVLSNLTNTEMSEVYRKSDIALGQLSRHPRLNYTIPHKAFEAGFFAKPYITANTSGIRELYGPDSAIFINDVSGGSLASEIVKLSKLRDRLALTTFIHSDYQRNASQAVLNEKFELIIGNL
jgi:glycosyltransferase involved in cell wall biosynthesis